VQEEAADDVGEALAEEGGEEHELVVEHQHQVPLLVRVGHHLCGCWLLVLVCGGCG
jgi:hypothetical protein